MEEIITEHAAAITHRDLQHGTASRKPSKTKCDRKLAAVPPQPEAVLEAEPVAAPRVRAAQVCAHAAEALENNSINNSKSIRYGRILK